MWRTHTHDKLGRAVEGRGYATMVKKLLWIEGSHAPFHQNNRKEQQRFTNNKPKTFPMALKAFFFLPQIQQNSEGKVLGELRQTRSLCTCILAHSF